MAGAICQTICCCRCFNAAASSSGYSSDDALDDPENALTRAHIDSWIEEVRLAADDNDNDSDNDNNDNDDDDDNDGVVEISGAEMGGVEAYMGRTGMRPLAVSPFVNFRRKLALVLFTLAIVLGIRFFLFPFTREHYNYSAHHLTIPPLDDGYVPYAAFQPAENVTYRRPDFADTFKGYTYRGLCDISSLELHASFSPLCRDRESMLTAMSSGGRIGVDAPFMPRGCDMRWFTTEEICEILGRFEKVIFVGDSMMRHVVGSINVLVRKNLGYGAVTDWNFTPQERADCFCNSQFNVKACSMQGIFKTGDVIKNDPSSVTCPAGAFDVTIEQMVRFPVPQEEIDRFKGLLGNTKPAKPYAFVLGHGLWNDLDLQATVDWLEQILDVTTEQLPYLGAPGAFWPRLMVTPNAAGKDKPDEWLVTQGNKALAIFEESVAVEASRRGIEHLGTWNMSIQATKYDGVHVDLKGNLVKAMMVLNWLNLLDVESH